MGKSRGGLKKLKVFAGRRVSRVFTLDSTPPEVELSGALAESEGQPLGSATAALDIDARDTDPASGGIETINIERDDQLVATFPSNCATDCHEVSASYGYHRAEDGAERKIQAVAPGEASAGELKRISCVAASDCWAVGRTKYTAGELAEGKTPAPLLEHWNGSEWQAVAVPKPAGAMDVFLEDVMCNSSSACRAVGYYNDGSTDRPLAELWNGTSWSATALALPSGIAAERLHGVSCPTANVLSCWFYGRIWESGGKPPTSFVQKTLGNWQSIPKPEGATDVFIEGITCTSTTLCRAVGYYSVGSVNLPLSETWDGTKWSAASLPLPSGATRAALSGLACDPAGGCWAVGKTQVNSTEQAEGKSPTPFFERWTGSQWQASTPPSVPDSLAASLNDVSCPSASACTAVGNYEDSHAETRSFSYTYDGSAWRYQPTPAPPEATLSSLEGLACTGANTCSMAGYSQLESGKRTVLAEAESAGTGPHSITIEAVDIQGNSTSETIEVDLPASGDETPQCDPEASLVSPKATVTPSEARAELEDVLPAAVEPSEGAIQETSEVEVDPTYSEPQPDLSAVHALADSETSVDSEGGFALADIACVVPEETTSAATEATVINQDTALFANTAPETDTVIRPIAGGTALVQSLRGPDAPTSFSWTIEVSSGQELEELPSGAVAIVEDPGPGEQGQAPELPMPPDAKSPKALTDADLQMELADYQLATAQSETSKEVVAVIPVPWVVLSEEWKVPAKIEVRPDVSIPIKWELEVTLPLGELEAMVYPVGLSMEFLSSLSVNGHCQRKQSPCGAPDLNRAARYAVYWGDENHHGARNPHYHDYESNNCTNFVSQILFAGGVKFMKAFDKGDGSWWYEDTNPFEVTDEYEDTRSWRLADVLPQHLWEYGLVHIDIQQPWAWTKGTILAEDWYGTNGKGDFNHMQFVVGTIDSPNGPREPLIANESSPGHNYSDLRWGRVREIIQAEEGGDGWSRVALPLKHTNANLKEKRYEDADLYDSGGLFGS
jgi:Putative amidase domain